MRTLTRKGSEVQTLYRAPFYFFNPSRRSRLETAVCLSFSKFQESVGDTHWIPNSTGVKVAMLTGYLAGASRMSENLSRAAFKSRSACLALASRVPSVSLTPPPTRNASDGVSM
jgi:hypothetical protein